MIESTERSLFNADHHAFRDTVRRFLAAEIAPHLDRHEANGIVEREAWEKAGAAGLLDTSGSALFLVATRHVDLSLVAPVAALYPVSTVVLALVVERERPRPPQLAGLLLAVAALQLVARSAA